MNDRKMKVINKAHELFIEKGYQATSIQDILEYSGISKGTFYNYFSSKGELLIAIFKTLQETLEKEQNSLLIGQDRSNIEVFIKQLELQMKINHKNKLFSLFEEAFLSNEAELKEFFKGFQFEQLGWFFTRFVDLFGEEKKPYLLDCAVMFTGIFHSNFRYSFLANENGPKVDQVIRYSVARLVKMVNEVAETGQQLLDPSFIEKWLPGFNKKEEELKGEFIELVFQVKLSVKDDKELLELIDFIQAELLHASKPRKFVIKSALFSLKNIKNSANKFDEFEQAVNHLLKTSKPLS
jgi:AcrR family transcriptional regulator